MKSADASSLLYEMRQGCAKQARMFTFVVQQLVHKHPSPSAYVVFYLWRKTSVDSGVIETARMCGAVFLVQGARVFRTQNKSERAR